jgi:hypothetical protein
MAVLLGAVKIKYDDKINQINRLFKIYENKNYHFVDDRNEKKWIKEARDLIFDIMSKRGNKDVDFNQYRKVGFDEFKMLNYLIKKIDK